MEEKKVHIIRPCHIKNSLGIHVATYLLILSLHSLGFHDISHFDVRRSCSN